MVPVSYRSEDEAREEFDRIYDEWKGTGSGSETETTEPSTGANDDD